MNGSLQGQIALVTGGGTGIGRAICLQLGQRGATVIVNYSRSRQEAEETAAEIVAQGGQSIALQADISDPDQVQGMMDQIESTYGRLDILVNNAGTTKWLDHRDLASLTPELFDQIIGVNLKGAYLCIRAALPIMKAGNIINITSIAGIWAKGSNPIYCASKAALNNLTISLARALGPEIRVNAVAPGLVPTRIQAGREESRKKTAEAAPLKRVATPDDIAEVVLALITGFRHVTGEIITVDGGTTIA
jgi:3-oxoacyl-[acyl-carrier protein] reductase